MNLVTFEHNGRTRLGELQPDSEGDVARADIKRLGALENPVVAEA